MDTLTQKQTVILGIIRAFIAEYGFAPSIREIRHRAGFSSTNGVKGHLRSLEAKGYIKVAKRVARGITICQ